MSHPVFTFIRIALVTVSICLLAGCPKESVPDLGVRFTTVMDGIEYARYRFGGTPSEQEFEGHLFRLDLEKTDLRVLPAGGPTVRREVEEIVRALPQAVAVNGSFFDEDGKAMGLVVDQGRLISRFRKRSWGALVIKERKARIVTGSDVDLAENPELVLQGQPRLVVDGKIAKLKEQKAKRVALCLTAKGDTPLGNRHLILVTASSVDARDLASFLALPKEKGGVGCLHALNLDGGPSAQLIARLDDVRVQTRGGDAVPNALVAIPGLAEPPASARTDTSAPVNQVSPESGEDIIRKRDTPGE
jgi:hypothetical protein